MASEPDVLSTATAGQPSIRVLVVDDHALYREIILDALEEEVDIEVVGEAADGPAALVACQDLQPDICLLDLEMPGMNGVEVTRRLVHQSPHTKIVVLTAYDEDRWIFELVQAGATGYLLKEAPLGEVVRAIRVAWSGESLIEPRVANKILRMFASLSQEAGPGRQAPSGDRPGLPGRLTEREVEVLSLVGKGLNNRELAEHLVISETTVKSHVSNIMHKLDLRDRVEMVLLAVNSGLIR